MVLQQKLIDVKCTEEMLSESALFCNDRSLRSVSLYSCRDWSNCTGHFLMDSSSFSVASCIERHRSFYFCSSPVNAVRELVKSLHVAIGFTLGLHGHVINLRFTFTSRSRRYGIHSKNSSVWLFTFALHVYVTRSRIERIPALGRYAMFTQRKLILIRFCVKILQMNPNYLVKRIYTMLKMMLIWGIHITN